MSRICLVAIPILAASTVAWNAEAQDIPGQIPDPSTYQGSVEQQRREDESATQVQQQNEQMQQRLDQNYAAYAPPAGGAGGSGGGAAVRLKEKPLLPPAKNPLLGRWRQIAGKPVNMGLLGALPGGSEVVNGAFGGACKSVFGTGMVAFTPTALNWVAPDGHEEILNHVEYRSDGPNVIVIPTDPDPIPFIFGFPNKDHAVAAFFGCAMARITGSAQPAAVTAQSAAAPAAAPAPSAILNLNVGETVSGKFSPAPAGIQVFVTTQNPDVNLVKAGFTSNPPAPPIENLFAACNIGHGGVQERCKVGMTALYAGALGAATSDAAGHAQTGALKPGRYYLVGFTPYHGHSLVWHMPVDLHAGSNSVTLTPQNGSVSH